MFDSNFDSTDMSVSDGVEMLDSEEVEFLETSDIQDSKDDIAEQQGDDQVDDMSYKATRLTEEQMKQIDELWEETKTKEVSEPYKATRFGSDDVTFSVDNDYDFDSVLQSMEEQFAAEVEDWSQYDLRKEEESLSKYDSELFNALTDGLSKEQLEQLKHGLAIGNQDTYEYFGLNGDVDESNGEHTRSRRK